MLKKHLQEPLQTECFRALPGTSFLSLSLPPCAAQPRLLQNLQVTKGSLGLGISHSPSPACPVSGMEDRTICSRANEPHGQMLCFAKEAVKALDPVHGNCFALPRLLLPHTLTSLLPLMSL